MSCVVWAVLLLGVLLATTPSVLFTKYEVVYVEYTCVVLAVHCASGAGLLGECTVCAGGLQYVWGCGGEG